MFLKSLEIYGFKSFADRSRIEFADGISALLGPNGCGKSNVVDAIKWVLGEQASRTLRAEKMEDVIFNGTEARKALGMAEVSIAIENSNGILPLDVPEIVVRRRLYRSGESEYSINSAPVKLKDVRELFWDTGIGKSAYSVMEQGRIDQILSSKPEERRYLFEEAAGITRFKVRGQEAERKLERTEENMRQVEGILGEVRRSYEGLKVQSEKTLVYRSLRDKIFEAELDTQLIRLRNAVNELSRRDGDIAAKEKAREASRKEIESLNSLLAEHMDAVNSLEARMVEHQKTVYGLAIEQNNKQKQRGLLQEREAEARAKLRQAESRKAGVAERIEGLREDIDEREQAQRALEQSSREIEGNISGFEESIRAAGERIGRNEAEIGKRGGDILALDEELQAHEAELRSIVEDIVTELEGKLRESGYSIQERKRVEAALGERLAALRILVAGRRDLAEDALRVGDGERAGRVAAEALASAHALTGEVSGLLAELLRAVPSFLDEFLAPEGIITRKRGIDARIAAFKAEVGTHRSAIEVLRGENRALAAKNDEYRATLEELRVNQARIKAQVAAAQEATGIVRRELAAQEGRLKEIEDEIFLEGKRLSEISEQVEELDSELADIERKGKELTAELEKLDGDIKLRNSDVAARRGELTRRQEELSRAAEQLERLHMDKARSEAEIGSLKESFREQHSRDLMEFEERMYEITQGPAELRDALAALRQKLKDLGSVNLMAVEEYAEAKQRFEFLSAQIADLQKAREDLNRITQEIRTESTELFAETYNRIRKNFHAMFRRLFGGGRAEVRLVDPDNVLESGIEIYAQPPGKKLENITLLSGGEKSLTAVALLFATYMVKPSPFCFLDEIDAALDEQNVLRFVNLLREFGAKSQFIVITHNKKTVAGADTLLGVTMEESGVTKVIAVRVEQAATAGAKAPPPPPIEEEDETMDGTPLLGDNEA